MVPLQALRFALVGIAAAAVHFGVGMSLAHLAGASPLTANAVAFVTALGVSYFGHSLWTFRVAAARAGAFARFVVVAVASFAANQGIVYGLNTGLGWTYAASLGVVLVTVPALTFVVSRSWAFAARPALKRSPAP